MRQVHRRIRVTMMFATMLVLVGAPVTAQERQGWTDSAATPRTPWGDPDLQGVWDYWTFTPLERPDQFAGRDRLTAEEAAEVAQRSNAEALARDEPPPPAMWAATVRRCGQTGHERPR